MVEEVALEDGPGAWKGVVRVRPAPASEGGLRAAVPDFRPIASAVATAPCDSQGFAAHDSGVWRLPKSSPPRSLQYASKSGRVGSAGGGSPQERDAPPPAPAERAAAPGLVLTSTEELQDQLRQASLGQGAVTASSFASCPAATLAATAVTTDTSAAYGGGADGGVDPLVASLLADAPDFSNVLSDVSESWHQLPQLGPLSQDPATCPAGQGNWRQNHHASAQSLPPASRNSLTPIPSSSILPCLQGAGNAQDSASSAYMVTANADEDAEAASSANAGGGCATGAIAAAMPLQATAWGPAAAALAAVSSACASAPASQARGPGAANGSLEEAACSRNGLRLLLGRMLRLRAISSNSAGGIKLMSAPGSDTAAPASGASSDDKSARRHSLQLPRSVSRSAAAAALRGSAGGAEGSTTPGAYPLSPFAKQSPQPPLQPSGAPVLVEPSPGRRVIDLLLVQGQGQGSERSLVAPQPARWLASAPSRPVSAVPRPHSTTGLTPAAVVVEAAAGVVSAAPSPRSGPRRFGSVKSPRGQMSLGRAAASAWFAGADALPTFNSGGVGGSRTSTGTGMAGAAAHGAFTSPPAPPLPMPEASHAVAFAGSLRTAPTAAMALAAVVSPSKRRFSASFRLAHSIDDSDGGERTDDGADGGMAAAGDGAAATPAAEVSSMLAAAASCEPCGTASGEEATAALPLALCKAPAQFDAVAAMAAAAMGEASAAPVPKQEAVVHKRNASQQALPTSITALKSDTDANTSFSPFRTSLAGAGAGTSAGAIVGPGGSCLAGLGSACSSMHRSSRVAFEETVSASNVELRRTPPQRACSRLRALTEEVDLEPEQAPEAERWHEIWVRRAVDPILQEDVLIIAQSDVTDRVVAERHLGLVMETEHRLLEQLYPRHILAGIVEDWAATAAGEAPGTGGAGSGTPRSVTEGTAAAAALAAAAAAAPAPADAAGGRPGQPGSRSLRSMRSIGRASSNGHGNGWRPSVRDPYSLATWHPQVTLLFADIVGFTPMCNEVEPRAVMHMLNGLFSRFDSRLDDFNVFKVETIGDCYFVAGGLVDVDEDGMATVRFRTHTDAGTHVRNVFRFAQAMLAAAREVPTPTTGTPVRLRIGIHTGPVVSGVVGTRMPRFCLFGDTVNTASRMESTGCPGAIHVSEAAYEHLEKEAEWEPTGGIEVKGKGHMRTYLHQPR